MVFRSRFPPSTVSALSRKRSFETAAHTDHNLPSHGPSVKRSRASTSSESRFFESDSDDRLSDSHDARAKAPRTSAKPGSSWAKQKALRNKATAEKKTFRPSSKKLSNFRQKVLDDDPQAEFDDGDLLWVRCSYCSSAVTMRALYDLHHWKVHRKSRKCRRHQDSHTRGGPSSGGTIPIFLFFFFLTFHLPSHFFLL